MQGQQKVLAEQTALAAQLRRQSVTDVLQQLNSGAVEFLPDVHGPWVRQLYQKLQLSVPKTPDLPDFTETEDSGEAVGPEQGMPPAT